LGSTSQKLDQIKNTDFVLRCSLEQRSHLGPEIIYRRLKNTGSVVVSTFGVHFTENIVGSVVVKLRAWTNESGNFREWTGFLRDAKTEAVVPEGGGVICLFFPFFQEFTILSSPSIVVTFGDGRVRGVWKQRNSPTRTQKGGKISHADVPRAGLCHSGKEQAGRVVKGGEYRKTKADGKFEIKKL
jgi:hypothetical protein